MVPHLKHILLIEDNAIHAQLVEELLRESYPTQFVVQVVPLLATAEQLLIHHSYDIILVDILLPDCQDVRDALTRLQRAAPSTPIVILTAVEDEALALEAVQHGAQDYLLKEHHLIGDRLGRAVLYAMERGHQQQTADAQWRQQLAESQGLLGLLAAQMADGLVILSEQEQVLLANPAAEQLLELSAAQLRLIPFPVRIAPDQTVVLTWPPMAASPRTLELRSVATHWQAQTVQIVSVRDLTATLLQRDLLLRQDKQIKLLNHMSAVLENSNTDVRHLLSYILEELELFQNTVCGAYLLDESRNELVARSWYPPLENVEDIRQPADEGIGGRVVRENAAVEITYFAQEKAHFLGAHLLQEQLANVYTSYSVPLRGMAQPLGVFHVGLKEERRFTAEEKQIIHLVAQIFSISFQRLHTMESLEQHVRERTRDLEAANERLRELDQLKNKFISDMTHELRTPVTNLRLYMDLMRRGRPEKREQYLAVIASQVERLALLSQNILTLAQLDAWADEELREQVELNKLVGTLVELYLPDAESKTIALRFEPAADLPPLVASPTQLTEMVVHLLTNALAYTQEGHVHVQTAYLPHERHVRLTVADTGWGIDGHEQKLVFERFYRGRETMRHNIPGTGLGLNIVQEIVRRHHGRLALQSKPNHGTTFHIDLPC